MSAILNVQKTMYLERRNISENQSRQTKAVLYILVFLIPKITKWQLLKELSKSRISIEGSYSVKLLHY